MRAANCKSVCLEIEEADAGQHLSKTVTEHLVGCQQCRTFHDERTKLRQLVASLETVAVPPDFDFRVRSRIANEKAHVHGGFFFGNFSLGLPSVALATLVLIVGGVFALRIWNASPDKPTALRTEKGEVNSLNNNNRGEVVKSEPTPLAAKSGTGLPEKQSTTIATRNEGSGRVRPTQRPSKGRSSEGTVAAAGSSRRVTSKEFSSTPAPVVKQEEAVASLEGFPIFLIESSSQPLRLSLDYSGGVSRTISVPALSFGSEKALAGDGISAVKNSPKGAW